MTATSAQCWVTWPAPARSGIPRVCQSKERNVGAQGCTGEVLVLKGKSSPGPSSRSFLRPTANPMNMGSGIKQIHWIPEQLEQVASISGPRFSSLSKNDGNPKLPRTYEGSITSIRIMSRAWHKAWHIVWSHHPGRRWRSWTAPHQGRTHLSLSPPLAGVAWAPWLRASCPKRSCPSPFLFLQMLWWVNIPPPRLEPFPPCLSALLI